MGLIVSYESTIIENDGVSYTCYKENPVKKSNLIWLIVLVIVVTFYIGLVIFTIWYIHSQHKSKIYPEDEEQTNQEQ